MGCRCDKTCREFGDCCSYSEHTHKTSIPKFDCVSTFVKNDRKDSKDVGYELHYYWMITFCPKEKSVSEVVNGPKLAELCEAQSLSSPPISDNRTGLVYRNKYCAQCHGVPDREQLSWQSQWICSDKLVNISKSNDDKVDIDIFLDICYPSAFVEPQWSDNVCRPFTATQCDLAVSYECQPAPATSMQTDEYCSIKEVCSNKPGGARQPSAAPGVYINEYCALCSRPTLENKELMCPPDNDKSTGLEIIFPPLNTFVMLLDVTGSGVEVLDRKDIQVISTKERSCGEGQVFNVYDKRCQISFCPLGYSYNGTSCLPTDPNCTLVALNHTEYKTINSYRILWIAVKQNVSVQGYSSEGNPLVCTNFTSDFNTTVNETITRHLYGYPAAFTILSYLGLSVDVVAAAILLFTYAAFAEMRTFYGKLFMNFVLVLLLGDLTFLLGSAVYAVSLEDVVCQVVAILLHYLFLARFVWMALLSLNVARHFYHAMKMVVNEERESWHYLILYMAAGWLSPLLALIVTVPVNYAIPGAVGYGVDGLCWMDETLAIVVSFIVPIAICILFTTGAFVFVCMILAKWHSSNVEIDKKHKTGSRNCRVLIAVFCITGATWVFGFLALIGSALSWAWYLFIIFNTTQAVFVTLAYVCTTKVLQLYRSTLRKAFRDQGRKLHSHSPIAGPTKQLELLT